MMKTTTKITIAAALCAIGLIPLHASERDLEARIAGTDGWTSYRVPRIADMKGPCCYSVRDGATTREGCDLDGRGGGFVETSGAAAADDGGLDVYLHVDHGHIDRVRAFGSACPVRSAGVVRRVEGVDPADSVALIAKMLDREHGRHDEENGLVALAYHADPSATRVLAARAEPSHAEHDREQALFWLGQTRGREGADLVEHYATTDANPELRAKAIFALSESHAVDAYAKIRDIARRDPSDHVRSQALFWMAQMKDARAAADISQAVRDDASSEVREQAVFALSQLEDGTGDATLIALVRGDYPREVKKKALFWLGQSGSKEAMAMFDEALK